MGALFQIHPRVGAPWSYACAAYVQLDYSLTVIVYVFLICSASGLHGLLSTCPDHTSDPHRRLSSSTLLHEADYRCVADLKPDSMQSCLKLNLNPLVWHL